MAGDLQAAVRRNGRSRWSRLLRSRAQTLGLFLVGSLLSGAALGQTTLNWGAGGAGGNGTWNTGTNWFNGTSDVVWSQGSNAVFAGTAGTVTLGAARTAGDVRFDTAGYKLAFNSLALTLSSLSGAELGATTFVGHATNTSGNGAVILNTTTGADVTFTGTIATNGLGSTSSLTKQGLGRLILGPGFIYTGNTPNNTNAFLVSSGTLRFGTTDPLPAGRRLSLGSGGTVLELAAGNWQAVASQSSSTNPMIYLDSGTAGFAAIGGDRTMTFANNNNVSWESGSGGATDRIGVSELILATTSSTGKLTLSLSNALGALRLQSSSASNPAGTYQRTVRVDNGTAPIDAEIALQMTDSTLAGRIGQILKVGDGVLALSRAAGNTYSGGTIVRGGTLLVNNTSNSGTGSGAVTVDAGAFLGGTGRVNGAVTADGGIAPGSTGIGTLTTGSDVTWNAGNSWLFQLGASAPSLAAATAGTDSDLLAVSTAFTKGTAGSFTFDFGTTGTDGWYKLVDYTSTTFTSGDFQATNVPSGKQANFVVDPDSTALYVQIVPEPGMLGLAGIGLGMATLSFMKRRRRA